VRSVVREEKHAASACAEIFDKSLGKIKWSAAEIDSSVHVENVKLFALYYVSVGVFEFHKAPQKIFDDNIITHS
jgi:hypothetical protein